MIISYIYEPYVITFMIAIMITIIYYLYKKNKDESQNLEKDEKGKKSKFHLGTHCILVFISFYSILTSLYYLLKNYISPYQNIQVDEMIKENITDKISEGIEILKENVIPSLIENRNEEDNTELEGIIEETSGENENEKMIYIAGKRKLQSKDKLKHIYHSKAKIIDNDVDTNPNSFDF